MGGGIVWGTYSPSEPSKSEGKKCPNLEIRLKFEICNTSSSSVKGRRKSAKVMGFLISLEDSAGVVLVRVQFPPFFSFIGCALTVRWEL